MLDQGKRESAPLTRSLAAYICYCCAHGATFDRSVMALFLLTHGLSETQLGTILSVLFLSQMLTEIPAGYFGDRFGRKLSVTTGLVVKTAWCGGMLLATSFAQFVGLFVLAGISRSLISGSDHSLVYDLMKQHGRAEQFVATEVKARALAGFALSLAMGVAGYMLERGPELLYGCYALTSALALGAWLLIVGPESTDLRSGEPPPADEPDPLHSIYIRRRVFAATVVAFAALSSVIAPFYFFAQTELSERGLSVAQVGLVYGGSELLAAATILLAKRVEARLTFVEILIGFSLLASVGLWIVSFPGLRPLALGFFLLVVVTPIFDVVVIHALHRRLDSRRRASWMSVASVVVTLAAALGYTGWGTLNQWTSDATVARVASLVPVLGVLVVLGLTRAGKAFDPTHSLPSRS